MDVIQLPMRLAFRASEWFVAETNLKTSNELVERYHYAKGAAPNGVYLHGLFLRGWLDCWGVAWWIPAIKGSIDKYNPGGYTTTLTLHRLVIHPCVPTNGASFLLGRSIRLIQQVGDYEMLITYADTWRGHTGQIYKATNWNYRGLTKPMPVWSDEQGVQRSTSNRLVGAGGERAKSPSKSELIEQGWHKVGSYPKHVYTMALKRRETSIKQVELPLVA